MEKVLEAYETLLKGIVEGYRNEPKYDAFGQRLHEFHFKAQIFSKKLTDGKTYSEIQEIKTILNPILYKYHEILVKENLDPRIAEMSEKMRVSMEAKRQKVNESIVPEYILRKWY